MIPGEKKVNCLSCKMWEQKKKKKKLTQDRRKGQNCDGREALSARRNTGDPGALQVRGAARWGKEKSLPARA